MKIELNLFGNDKWPRCFYNRDLRCGEPETGKYQGYNQEKKDFNKFLHVADMCNCPSCPLRCAIRNKLWELKRQALDSF